MDDFNAELLSSQEALERRRAVDKVLKGATEEYHKERCDTYVLLGVLSRLIAVYTEAHDAWGEPEAFTMYDVVAKELIDTLTSYLSQG